MRFTIHNSNVAQDYEANSRRTAESIARQLDERHEGTTTIEPILDPLSLEDLTYRAVRDLGDDASSAAEIATHILDRHFLDAPGSWRTAAARERARRIRRILDRLAAAGCVTKDRATGPSGRTAYVYANA